MVPREVQAIFREAHSNESLAVKQRGILQRIKGVYARNKTWFKILALVVAGASVAYVARQHELSPAMRAKLEEVHRSVRAAPASARARITRMLMTEENRQVEAYAKDPVHPNATPGDKPNVNTAINSKALVVYKPPASKMSKRPANQMSTAVARTSPPAPKTSPLRNPALPKVPTFPESWFDLKGNDHETRVFASMDRFKTQLLRGVRNGTISKDTARRRITDLVRATPTGMSAQLKAVFANFYMQMSLLNHAHRPTEHTKQIAHDEIRQYTTGKTWWGPRSRGERGWYDGTNAREVYTRGGVKPGRGI